MSKPVITWHGATIGNEIILPSLRPLAGGAAYNYDGIVREGFNHLWGWIAADDTFTVAVSFSNRGAVEGMGWLVASVADPVTPFQVVNFDGLHLTGNTWNILITGVGLNMANIHHHLEIKP